MSIRSQIYLSKINRTSNMNYSLKRINNGHKNLHGSTLKPISMNKNNKEF